jgi:sugar/nucleoside kinase (ribokinase family)
VRAPEFLAVGHLCCDRVDGRKILGGSASYASLTARGLGRDVGVVTAFADDFPFADTFRNILVENVGSPSTTVFENIYRNGVREQFVESVASSIQTGQIPHTWKETPVVYLCPIAGEVMADVVRQFPDALIGIGAQGWFREWDAAGRVRRKQWIDAEAIVSYADAVVYSELDIDEPYAFAEELSRFAPIVIVTQSSQGAELFVKGDRIHVPAYEIKEIDPTGAGDVFAAAFLVRYWESKSVVEAARFACCTASFVCEKEGTEGIPTLQQVLARKGKAEA